MRFVWSDFHLRALTTFGALADLALTGYQAVLVVFLMREVGLTPGVVGAVISGMSAGGVAGAACSPHLAHRFGTARALLLSAASTAPFALLIPLTQQGPRLAYVVLGGFVVGAGVVSGNVIEDSWRQAAAHGPLRVEGRPRPADRAGPAPPSGSTRCAGGPWPSP